MPETSLRKQLTPQNGRYGTSLRGLRDLHYNSNIQGRTAARALLPGSNPCVLALDIDVRGNGVGTNRAMCLPLRVVLNECFHIILPHFIRREFQSTGCTKIVKILKGPRNACRRRGCSADATLEAMTQPAVPKIENTPDYRENYANSVQVRVNLWDFLFLFGRVYQTAPDHVAIQNFQGIYVSPQQAKALLNVLQQNVTQYESAFGEIRLEPQTPGGIVQ